MLLLLAPGCAEEMFVNSAPKKISLTVSETAEWMEQNVQENTENGDDLLHCLVSTVSEDGVQDCRKLWSFQHGNAYIPSIINMVHWEHKEVCYFWKKHLSHVTQIVSL